jgi:hypothetical protein
MKAAAFLISSLLIAILSVSFAHEFKNDEDGALRHRVVSQDEGAPGAKPMNRDLRGDDDDDDDDDDEDVSYVYQVLCFGSVSFWECSSGSSRSASYGTVFYRRTSPVWTESL